MVKYWDMADKLINKLIQEAIEDAQNTKSLWPDTYINKDTGKVYKPHTPEEEEALYNDKPPYVLVKAGEGSGKSVFLIIKVLNRLRRGMDGAIISPNLPHFKRSLFPELLRWLPREVVIEEHQRYFHPSWTPHTSFYIVVRNEIGGYSKLLCTGGDNPIHLEGPNLNFCGIDELRGFDNDEILKVMSGRIRVPGPNGEPPQLIVASTPAMHFMFDYFGPEKPEDEQDEYRNFKRQSRVVTLKTEDNLGNIDEQYIETRGATLTEAQKQVRLYGEWQDEGGTNRFLEDILFWDSLKDPTLPLLRTRNDPNRDFSDVLVLAADGSVKRDHFALIGVTRHPRNRKDIAVRIVKSWIPKAGTKLDFVGSEKLPGPELFIKKLCETYNVVCLVYDEYQLHQMMTGLMKQGIVWTKEFSQNAPRLLADQNLYDLIIQKKIFHDGNKDLRLHMHNADCVIDEASHKRRIVKRADSLKIDLSVACSMSAYESMRLNL